ncbi:MAG TPA: tetratricopeptide repeat protein, partial [Sediminispirochaeta sp.]|nr:tetratricopeptide repeat protein [Sediminispirochaeta sp.]
MKRLILLFLYMSALLVSLGAQEERLFREAERRFHGGEYQFAASRYERLIEEYPNSPYVADAKFRQALISMYQQKYPQALEALSRIVDRYPHTRFYEQIPFWQGYGHFRLGDYETALEMFEKAQGAKSENIRRDVLLYLSMTQKRLGQEEGALASARKLIAMLDELTEESEVLLLYTALLLENQRYQELYDLYGELNLDNLDPDIRRRILLYRAEALFQQEEYQDVEPLYNELLEGEEELKLIAFKRLFVLYGRTGQQEKQQEVFDKAQNELAGKPEALAEFLLRAGIQHFQAGRYDLARSFFQRIWRTVSIERVDGLVPLYLSRIMERGGELSEAVRMIEGYLQQSSDQREELLFALVRIQSKQSHWKEAVAGAELFLQDYPGSSKRAEIHYLYAYSLYRGGSHREALAVLQEGLAEGAKAELDLDMLRLRSRIYSRLERIDEAIEDLREYLPRRKGDSSAYIDLAKLAFSKQEWSLIADTLRRYREYREGETELGELALTDPIYIQLN